MLKRQLKAKESELAAKDEQLMKAKLKTSQDTKWRQEAERLNKLLKQATSRLIKLEKDEKKLEKYEEL